MGGRSCLHTYGWNRLVADEDDDVRVLFPTWLKK